VTESRTVPSLAVVGLLITGAGAVYAGSGALSGWEPGLGWLIQAVIHLGELTVVIALALSGAAGSGVVARVGLGTAMAGQAVLAVAEVVWPGAPDLGDTLFGVGPLLTGAGLIMAGIAVLRRRAAGGLLRYAPLANGVYVVVVMLPVLIGSGGPPAPAALWTICGWDLLWAAMAAALLIHSRNVRTQHVHTTHPVEV
jgi:hypothetical protein